MASYIFFLASYIFVASQSDVQWGKRNGRSSCCLMMDCYRRISCKLLQKDFSQIVREGFLANFYRRISCKLLLQDFSQIAQIQNKTYFDFFATATLLSYGNNARTNYVKNTQGFIISHGWLIKLLELWLVCICNTLKRAPQLINQDQPGKCSDHISVAWFLCQDCQCEGLALPKNQKCAEDMDCSCVGGFQYKCFHFLPNYF